MGGMPGGEPWDIVTQMCETWGQSVVRHETDRPARFQVKDKLLDGVVCSYYPDGALNNRARSLILELSSFGLSGAIVLPRFTHQFPYRPCEFEFDFDSMDNTSILTSRGK